MNDVHPPSAKLDINCTTEKLRGLAKYRSTRGGTTLFTTDSLYSATAIEKKFKKGGKSKLQKFSQIAFKFKFARLFFYSELRPDDIIYIT
jgi:hypothetical protein